MISAFHARAALFSQRRHRFSFYKFLLLQLGCTLLFACAGESETTYSLGKIDAKQMSSANFNWRLPEGMPLPVIPEDNPVTEAKFQLGRHLFYDKRLSGNGTQSCESCHEQAKSFTDGKSVAVGSTGEVHPRNSQNLLNSAYSATLTWANPALLTLEAQAVIPLFGEFPVEQGITDGLKSEVLQRLQQDERYQQLFADAFPDEPTPFQFEFVVKALATFVRGMVSFNTPFDRYEAGDKTALSDSAIRGKELFFSEQMECFHCHGGYHFSDSTLDSSIAFPSYPFHNTGLFNIGGSGDFPEDNQGLYAMTGDPGDMGKFRAPTLRNIELTAPYMHDGSMATLEEVVAFYAAGGRVIENGSNAGDGRLNPFKSGFVSGFTLSEPDKADLVRFLKALTDESFVNDPRFANPWIE